MPVSISEPENVDLPQPSQHVSAADDPHRADVFVVVGIGASAGGLEACMQLMAALPADTGMAFILIQHLDPTHESLMVELLAGHTAMTVRQAASGMPLEPNHLYVIPPGSYLSVHAGALLLSHPQARHGARMPVDFLLRSLAAEIGARAICVILSGTGADGSLGIKAVKEQGGLVIAQKPEEAAYDGMPRNAILTGAVDLVLPIAEIPGALIRFDRRMAAASHADGQSASADPQKSWLPEIIELLRTKTAHDFTLYKHGTLQRRIERRMAMAAIETDGMDRYLELLRSDTAELDLLARDLLINVTSFFRDSQVFEFLERKTIPELIQREPPNQTLRIWIAGCSTGQEAYSLAMLFQEQITELKSSTKLQFFASDVDPDAVANAREGSYPDSIESEVSPKRLARFFSKEEHGYRVRPDLRASIVFTVQDILADPPFSRLDMISCRNLLIYLQPEAQAKVISLFHFALSDGGLLLLGSAETASNVEGSFEYVSKAERLYRHIGRVRSRTIRLPPSPEDGFRVRTIPGQGPVSTRQTTLAELSRRLVLESFAPAAILINRHNECLYSLGPTDKYLRVPPGHHSRDLLAMARPGMRGKLKSAIQRAYQEKARIVVDGGRMSHNGHSIPFSVDVQPAFSAGEELLLVCFVDDPAIEAPSSHPAQARNAPRATELEQELEATKAELQGALRDIETSNEEQKAINEEALSANEEFQSTNEELLTSKEELQSLNEELTALNSQLQETLERQRITSDDLQNVLYSTDVATLFLDMDFKIRFFTPASRALFNIIDSDVGRPLADLRSLSSDDAFVADAKRVLDRLLPIEREIDTPAGTWFMRRILPYRSLDKKVEGVVITFTDITERKLAVKALDVAKQQAELANRAKTRFLAAASHDLRQPLQTLALLHGLLAKSVEAEKPRKLIVRLGETLDAMSGMLNTLLDINQIEAGIVQAEIVRFPVDKMLTRLKDEFTYHAQAQGLVLRVVPCSLEIDSDPRLLEQMVRNLLSNALKYTKRGRVLLGCRRHAGSLSIEIWDTGVGIPNDQLHAIFEEYHQLDNAARERNRGLGLGLSIVQRLGRLLGHHVRVESRKGKGSVFAIEIALPSSGSTSPPEYLPPGKHEPDAEAAHRTGAILVIEDDPDVREILQLFLQDEGHLAATTQDGNAALDLVTRGAIRPDLILADYNLPNGLNGLQLALRLRKNAGTVIPVIILTGDISTDTLRSIAEHNFLHLTKPVRLEELKQAVQRLLPGSRLARSPLMPPPLVEAALPCIFIVDDDARICDATRSVLEDDGYHVETYPSGEAFLEAYRPSSRQCLLIDAYLPGMNGIELLKRLYDSGHHLPSIVITGHSDVQMAVQAMKAGAQDFIEKPISGVDLLASISRALEQAQDSNKRLAWRESAARQMAGLTPRQRQIMALVLAGQPSKNIAADLAISQRTVENHRASIMRKTGATSLPALARLALAAES